MDPTTLTRDVDERRTFMLPIEFRASDAGSVLEGYAAVFNQDTQIGGDRWGWLERIAPGAFRQSIAADDIRALFNHDANQVLGRSTTKTLTLAEDTKGLLVRMTLPDTAAGRDVITLVKRGDVSGQSFSFRSTREEWAEPTTKGQLPRRTLLEVTLFDVGPVTFPAYTQTSIAARDRARALQDALDQVAREVDEDRTRRLRLAQAWR